MHASAASGQWWMLAFLISVCFGAAGVGSWVSRSGQSRWYSMLRKPPGTPPDWVFGPVWTVLYLCMGIAAWMVWRQAGWSGARLGLELWVLQLLLNVTWSWLFFGLRRPELALVDVVALWVLILLTVLAFQPVSVAAAWLLVPYLLWVAYAGRLNFLLWRLNS